ncbi:MAG: antibiotic biosynthesis monooxygenase [Gemmatimonadota bacterium]
MFVYLWEYRVAPENRADFEREYGPDGSWVALFSGSPNYLGTTLLQDRSEPDRFLTIDRWESERFYTEFVESVRAEFDAIDARCEELTQAETLLGHFRSAGGAF